jgi:hypothetical protein
MVHLYKRNILCRIFYTTRGIFSARKRNRNRL